jgi:hypothetical protein
VTTKVLAAASPLAGQATFGSGLVFGAAATVVGLIGIAKARDGMLVTPAPPMPSLVGLLGGLGGLLFAAAVGLLVSSAGITWPALNDHSRSSVDVNVPGSSDGPFAGPTTIISTDGLGPSFADGGSCEARFAAGQAG